MSRKLQWTSQSSGQHVFRSHPGGSVGGTKWNDHEVQHITSKNLVLQQHILLKLQLVGILALCQTESSLQVFGQVLLLLDGRNDSFVDSLLVDSFRFGELFLLLGFTVSEEFFLRRGAALDGSLDKVGIVDLFVDLNARKKSVRLSNSMSEKICTYRDALEVNPGGGSNNVRLVYPSQRDTVDPERTSNQQQSTLQLLQENNPLSPEPPSQQNQNRSRSDRRTKLGGNSSLPALLWLPYIFGWVVSGSF